MEDVFGRENPLDGLDFGLQQVGAQRLSAEEIRDEPVSFLNDSEGREDAGAQIGSGDVGSFSSCRFVMNARFLARRDSISFKWACAAGNPAPASGPRIACSGKRPRRPSRPLLQSIRLRGRALRNASMSSALTEEALRASFLQNCSEAKSCCEKPA